MVTFLADDQIMRKTSYEAEIIDMHTKLAVSDNLLTSLVGKDLVGLEDYYYLLR